jgi:hypothetical protein
MLCENWVVVGNHFRLTRSIRASQEQDKNAHAITIPEDTVLTIESLYDADHILRVRFENGQALVLIGDLRANSSQLPSDPPAY